MNSKEEEQDSELKSSQRNLARFQLQIINEDHYKNCTSRCSCKFENSNLSIIRILQYITDSYSYEWLNNLDKNIVNNDFDVPREVLVPQRDTDNLFSGFQQHKNVNLSSKESGVKTFKCDKSTTYRDKKKVSTKTIPMSERPLEYSNADSDLIWGNNSSTILSAIDEQTKKKKNVSNNYLSNSDSNGKTVSNGLIKSKKIEKYGKTDSSKNSTNLYTFKEKKLETSANNRTESAFRNLQFSELSSLNCLGRLRRKRKHKKETKKESEQEKEKQMQ